MINVWVLTVIFAIHTNEAGQYRPGSSTMTSQQYIYKTRDECISAQKFYNGTRFSVSTSCATSYVVGK